MISPLPRTKRDVSLEKCLRFIVAAINCYCIRTESLKMFEAPLFHRGDSKLAVWKSSP